MKSEIWRKKTVRAKTGLSDSSIYALMSKGRFPKNFKINGTSASGWNSLEIQDWIDAQIVGGKEAGEVA